MWRPLAVNGAFVALLMALFRVDLAVALDAGLPSGVDAARLLGDALAIGALETGLFVAAMFAWSHARRLWLGLAIGVHAGLFAMLVAGQQFFLHTGTQLDLELLVYGAANARELAGLVGTGVDAGLALRASIAALGFAVGAAALLQRPEEGRNVGGPLPVLPAAAVAVALLAASGIVHALQARSSGARIGASIYGFVAGGRAEGLSGPVAVRELYVPPVLASGGGPARRPNVVLVVLESTRTDVIPPWSPREFWGATPFLAEFSRDAIVFDSTYTTVSHTSKALVGILCGMYPRLEREIVESSRPGAVPLRCLPDLLRELGYATGFFQTAHGSFENRPGLVRNLGFEHWQTQEDMEPGFARTGYFGMDEFAMVEPALDWLARRREGEPFFLTLLTVSTHHPYQAPGKVAFRGGDPRPHYLSSLRHVDRFVGDVYAKLAAAGELEDTLFLILGDHGEAFGEHTRQQHDVVPYEEGVRVPFMLKGPAWLGPPRLVPGLRSHLDLVPTLLRILGVDWDGRLPGRDLLESSGHRAVVSSCWYDDYCMSLRTGGLKFVYHYERQPTEVFHLESDPNERRDLAAEIPRALVESAERELVSIRRSVDAYYASTEEPRDAGS